MAPNDKPNPRAVIGHNGCPPDEEDTKSPPTIEEITRVLRAIEYVKFRAPDMEELLTKRKGGRIMGWRLALAWALKGSVRLVAVHTLLQLNRKTAGENQQRPDKWMELDDELDEQLADLREAIFRDGSIDFEKTDKLLKKWIRRDPELRKMEELQREHEKAAREAETEAARLAELAKARQLADFKHNLKGARGKKALIAEHKGAKQLARELSDDCMLVIDKIVVKEAAGGRLPYSSFDAANEHGATLMHALQECIRQGLARKCEPHLSKSPDPPIAPTDLGVRVYAEGIKSERIEKPKAKKKKPKPSTTESVLN